MIEVAAYVAARRYLAPYPDSFWRWDIDGKVLEWNDGTTIAFREELGCVLQRLAPSGLPPMNAVVLLLAACRDSWQGMSNELSVRLSAMGREPPEWITDVLNGLDDICDLPADLRNNLETKAVLAEMVLNTAEQRLKREESALVLKGMAASTDPGMIRVQQQTSRTFNDLLNELRELKSGLPRVDADALRLRLKTGLDSLVKPAEVNLSPADRVRRLIAELRDDEALGGVSRMAGQLMAAMNLPRPINDCEELPVGGVSDISNRGQLDRLLISELAHDDLTLAVRVAVGEALYLRREAPPRRPPRHRMVLIDAGIRLWGVPRVFATAVALAIAASQDHSIEVDLFRADGSNIIPVDLTHREGLIEHMAALTVHAHPGEALAPMMDAIESRAEKGIPSGDMIVITGDDVLADDDFRRTLADLNVPSLFFATVNRDGHFRLMSHATHGDQLVSEACLNLDDLLTARSDSNDKRARPTLVDPRRSTDLPAILNLKPFPLLLSYQPIDPQRHWVCGDNVLGITRQRCLMRWSGTGQPPFVGADLLGENLPDGTVHWCSAGPSESSVVVGQLQQGKLSLIHLDSQMHYRVIPLEVGQKRPLGVSGHGGKLFVAYLHHVDVFDLQTGQKQEPFEPKHAAWKRDRFFDAFREWQSLAYDGMAVRLDSVPAPSHARYLTFMDVAGHDGPFGITDDGKLYSSTDKSRIEVSHGLEGPLVVRAVARDGRYVVLSSADKLGRMSLVEIPSGKASECHGDPLIAVEPRLQLLHARSVRSRFQGIFVDDDNRLTLLTPKKERLRIECREVRKGQCQMALLSSAGQPNKLQNFRPLTTRSDLGFTLQVATWDDGSRAILDSRGMLHLMSSDRSVPEATLVMSEGAIAGWSADGRLWGDSYFTGKSHESQHSMNSPHKVYSEIILPFVARLR